MLISQLMCCVDYFIKKIFQDKNSINLFGRKDNERKTKTKQILNRYKTFRYRLPAVNLSLRYWFSWQQVLLFSVNIGIYRWQSHWTMLQNPSSKTWVKLVFSPGLALLITRTSGSNSPCTTIDTTIIRSSRPVFFCKKPVFTISQNSQENNCAGVLLLMKLQIYSIQLYQKIDFGTVDFLWSLQNFPGYLFYRTSTSK